MKAIRIIGLVVPTILILSACGKDNPSNPSNDPTPGKEVTPDVSIATTSQTLSSDGGTATIAFTATGSWTATSNVDWVVINQTQGNSGSITLTITVKTNEEYDQREGLIVISSGNVSKSVSVTQKQKDALLVTSNSIILDGEGGTPTIEVKANIDYSCKVDDSAKSWISVVSTRALTTSNITLSISENIGTSDRQGIVVVYSGDKQEVVTVYQKAKASSATTSLAGTSWYFIETYTNSTTSGGGYGYSYNTTCIISFRADGTCVLSNGKVTSVYNNDGDMYTGTYTSNNSKYWVLFDRHFNGTSWRSVDISYDAEIIDNVLYLFYSSSGVIRYRFFKL